jgi:hypothetical protein
MLKKYFLWVVLFAFSIGLSEIKAVKKDGLDPKIEKEWIESIYSIGVLVATSNDEIYKLSNLVQAKNDINSIIRAMVQFKIYDHIKKSIEYLHLAKKFIDESYEVKGAEKESFLTRKFKSQKAQSALFKAEQIIKFGEVQEYKSALEEKKDFYNRVVAAKKSLHEVISKLKSKKPELKDSLKIVQQVKDSLRPFLRYQVINRVDIFLTVFAIKHLNLALEEKDRLEKERNVQHAILSLVYAIEFLDDAEKDLKELF